MRKLIAALRDAKPTQIPQMGLRLANGLAGVRPPTQFWQEYVRVLGEPAVFSRLGPHSKCLLTCVACKMDKESARVSQVDKLVKRVFMDTMEPRMLSLLNLELLNMLLVACYTLRVPISDRQLLALLHRGNELARQDNYFNVEFTVSLLHSLGSLSRVYPRMRETIASSELVLSMVDSFAQLSQKVTARELSLLLYSFDKLQLMEGQLCTSIVHCVEERRQEIRGQELATILFACSSHTGTQQVLRTLRREVGLNTGNYTGREVCNICCAYLKAGMWEECLLEVLMPGLPRMNAQELCNVVNLMLHTKVDPSETWKSAYVEHLDRAVERLNLSLLDSLTMVQSLFCWGLQGRVERVKLDVAVTKGLKSDRTAVGAKHVYLLHYCFLIECRQAANVAIGLVAQQIDDLALGNKEMVVLFNAVCNMKVESGLVHKLGAMLSTRISEGQRFSDIDLQTLARWGDCQMKEAILKMHLSPAWVPRHENVKLLGLIIKDLQSLEAIDLAKRAVNEMLLAPCDGEYQAPGIVEAVDKANIESKGQPAKPDIGTIVAACEMLPYLQENMDVVAIFEGTLHRIQRECRLHDIEVRLLITLLSVARRLNSRPVGIAEIANAVTLRADRSISQVGLLEYLNAVHHLEIGLNNIGKVAHLAKAIFSTSNEPSVKEAITLTLSAMCFAGVVSPGLVLEMIRELDQVSPADSDLRNKALFMSLLAARSLKHVAVDDYGSTGTAAAEQVLHVVGDHSGNNESRSLKALGGWAPDDRNQIQSSVYATLRKLCSRGTCGETIAAEAPVGFDYVTDILVTRSQGDR